MFGQESDRFMSMFDEAQATDSIFDDIRFWEVARLLLCELHQASVITAYRSDTDVVSTFRRALTHSDNLEGLYLNYKYDDAPTMV